MSRRYLLSSVAIITVAFGGVLVAGDPLPPSKIDPVPKPLASDPTVKLDYDIVYVRAPRFVAGPNGKQRPSAWPEIGHPTNINAGYDLMVLHPDGSEEILVPGGEGSIADPFVSFDAEWVYYANFYLGKLGAGSDIYKVHVKSKRIVRLTHQEATPNMVLNMAQTWHQVRPGEIRNNCGGCHAHSQQPTPFEKTAAARPDYQIFDLTKQTPLVTSNERDQSGHMWDARGETGLRYDKAVKDVEYHRDVRPIFERSCVACHSHKLEKPAANLALDDDRPVPGPRWDLGNAGPVPATYQKLAGNFLGITRYVRGFQARRSLLVWKVYGQRLDGLPAQPLPGKEAIHKRILAEENFTGSIMPPPEAVKAGKVKALSDEDRRTLVRWIDLGCPVDLAFDPKERAQRGDGWFFDDQRPTLTLTYPERGVNQKLDRILVGMHDYGTGLDMKTFEVLADFAVDGVAAGLNLATQFKQLSDGVWELRLAKAIDDLPHGKLTVSVRDRQGNVSRIERSLVANTPR